MRDGPHPSGAAASLIDRVDGEVRGSRSRAERLMEATAEGRGGLFVEIDLTAANGQTIVAVNVLAQ